MKKEWFENPWIIAFPIVIFLAFAIWYGTSQIFFVGCKEHLGISAGCFPVEFTNLYRPDPLELDERNKPVTKEPQTDAGIRKTLSQRYSGRFVWMFAIVMNALCALGAWGIALFTINRWIAPAESGDRAEARKFIGKRPGLKWVGAFAITTIAISLLVVRGEGENIAPIYGDTIGLKVNGGINNIAGVMNTIHVLTFMGVFSLIAAMCVIAFPNKDERIIKEGPDGVKKGPGFEKKALDILLEKKNWLSFLLYTATVLLVISVARMHATLSWTTVFMTTDTVDGAREFYAQFTTILGAFYTLMLAAIYLPIAYIVFERGRTAQGAVLNKSKGAKRDKKEEVPDEKAAPEIGFKFSFAEAFPKFLAILAPFLAGPIAELLKYIAGSA